jgi:predicted RNA-binding protein with PUA domain
MKITVDGELLLELSDIKKKVINNEIPDEFLDEDLKGRIVYIIETKYAQCFKVLKEEWDQKLKENGIKSIPLDEEEYARVVFSQPNYKSRKQRDAII